MNNLTIRKRLDFRSNKALTSLSRNKDLDPLLKKVLEELFFFDFKTYQEQLSRELLVRVEARWTKKDILGDQHLDAILFEYDNFFLKGCKASVHEIYTWEDKKVHTNCFDMGSNYQLATELYETPSISLNFFDGLHRLEYENLPDSYKNDPANAIEQQQGYYDVIMLHKYEGMIAIHEVLVDLDEKEAFKGLNYKDDFMFLITAKDSGETYPLLIKRKNLKYL